MTCQDFLNTVVLSTDSPTFTRALLASLGVHYLSCSSCRDFCSERWPCFERTSQTEGIAEDLCKDPETRQQLADAVKANPDAAREIHRRYKS